MDIVKARKLALLPLLLSGVLLAGCNTTITNLTPEREFRNANGLYPIEVALASSQQSMRWSSIKPSVIVGKEFYPMRFTPMMTNRWETLVPIPPGNNAIAYRFKFDYTYNNFGTPPQPDSKLSPTYKLMILDR